MVKLKTPAYDIAFCYHVCSCVSEKMIFLEHFDLG